MPARPSGNGFRRVDDGARITAGGVDVGRRLTALLGSVLACRDAALIDGLYRTTIAAACACIAAAASATLTTDRA